MALLFNAGSGLLHQEMIVAVGAFQNTASLPAMIVAVATDLLVRISESVRES